MYFLRFDSPHFDQMAMEWETAATNYIKKKWSKNSIIEVIIFLYI